MNQERFANIVLIILVVLLSGVAGYFALNNRPTTPTPTPPISEQPISPLPSPLPPTPSQTPDLSPKPTPIENQPISLLKVCPEEWYDNRMPSTVEESNDVSKEYFIYKGVRRELSEFDVNWVKTNCSVKPQAVY